MNRTNRVILLLFGLTLVAVPAVLLVSNYGIALGGLVSSAAQQWWPFSASPDALASTTALVILGAVGAVVALVGVALVLGELRTIVGAPARPVHVESEPGRETVVTPDAVINLTTARSAEAGALDPVVRLYPDHDTYGVEVSVHARSSSDLRELAGRLHSQVDEELERQHVPVRELDVIVTELV
jgi:hypothetical protein